MYASNLKRLRRERAIGSELSEAGGCAQYSPARLLILNLTARKLSLMRIISIVSIACPLQNRTEQRPIGIVEISPFVSLDYADQYLAATFTRALSRIEDIITTVLV